MSRRPINPVDTQPEEGADVRLLSRAEVLERIGIPRATWYRMRQRGEFPAPSRLGAQCVGWLEADVDKWLEQRGIACRSHRDP